nr:MAG TPA: hypothetical protein [Caudoviricetes sp.]
MNSVKMPESEALAANVTESRPHLLGADRITEMRRKHENIR